MRAPRLRTLAAALCLSALVGGLTACTDDDSTSNGNGPAARDKATRAAVDQALHEALPQRVRTAGKLVVVMPGVNPPWWKKDGSRYTGAAAELTERLGEVLGVRMEYVPVNDLAGAFAAVASGRYDAGFNPYGDTGKATNVELVDVVREIVPFLVPRGNPKKINTLGDMCGRSVAALGPAGMGSAYQVLTDQSKTCVKEGKKAVNIVPLKSVPEGVLAVKSRRADAFFASGAPLSFYAAGSDGALELAGKESANGFDNLYQGMILPVKSPLTPTVLAAFQKLFDNGEYERIMKQHGLTDQLIDAPGVDLARKPGK
ncbi:transporter substrate-binding domain-containing protein [Streptomyces sp. NPDC049906]|uniref:transporter substrate-binding domain-containing protein n=1 Tax=Streptomyces sp. NPDC049906 TaxID=3155656 RepID=UPI00342F8A97